MEKKSLREKSQCKTKLIVAVVFIIYRENICVYGCKRHGLCRQPIESCCAACLQSSGQLVESYVLVRITNIFSAPALHVFAIHGRYPSYAVLLDRSTIRPPLPSVSKSAFVSILSITAFYFLIGMNTSLPMPMHDQWRQLIQTCIIHMHMHAGCLLKPGMKRSMSPLSSFLSPSLISHQTTASKKVISLIEINKDMGKKINFY